MSDSIKRYELFGLGQMNQRADGGYVTYEDHEKDKAEAVADLRRKLDLEHKSLKDWVAAADDLVETCGNLRRKLDRTVGALRWYADETNWRTGVSGHRKEAQHALREIESTEPPEKPAPVNWVTGKREDSWQYCEKCGGDTGWINLQSGVRECHDCGLIVTEEAPCPEPTDEIGKADGATDSWEMNGSAPAPLGSGECSTPNAERKSVRPSETARTSPDSDTMPHGSGGEPDCIVHVGSQLAVAETFLAFAKREHPNESRSGERDEIMQCKAILYLRDEIVRLSGQMLALQSWAVAQDPSCRNTVMPDTKEDICSE